MEQCYDSPDGTRAWFVVEKCEVSIVLIMHDYSLQFDSNIYSVFHKVNVA